MDQNAQGPTATADSANAPPADAGAVLQGQPPPQQGAALIANMAALQQQNSGAVQASPGVPAVLAAANAQPSAQQSGATATAAPIMMAAPASLQVGMSLASTGAPTQVSSATQNQYAVAQQAFQQLMAANPSLMTNPVFQQQFAALQQSAASQPAQEAPVEQAGAAGQVQLTQAAQQSEVPAKGAGTGPTDAPSSAAPVVAPGQPATANPASQQQQGGAPVAETQQPSAQGAAAPQPQQTVAMMPQQQQQQLLQMMGSAQPVPGAMMVAAPGQAVVPGQTTQSGQQPQLLFNPAAAVMQQPGMTFTPPNLGMNLQQLQQIQLAQQIMASTGGAAAANPLAAMAAANPLVAQQAMMAAGLMMNPQLQQQMQQTMQQQQSGQVVVGQPQLAQALPGQVASGLVAVAGTPTATTTTSSLPGGSPPGQQQIEWAEPFAGKGKKEPSFVLKLHQILSNPEFQECICWNPHGRSWRILKPPVFEQLVVPLYFRHAKYASFMRQVNGWGFKRVVSGNDHNSYYHEHFLRDYPQLCLKMKRIRKGEKPAKDVADSNPGTDENGNSGQEQQGTAGKSSESEKSSTDNQNGPAAVAGLATGSGVVHASSVMRPQSLVAGLGGVSSELKVAQPQALGAQSLQQATTTASTGPTTAGARVPPALMGLDNAALMKLQEALKASAAEGASLQQPPQSTTAQSSVRTTAVANSATATNNNLEQLGGNLAAQLQAATQAPTVAVAAEQAKQDDSGSD